MGGAVLCRPHTALVALPIAVYVIQKHRDKFMRLVLAGIPWLLIFVSYNAACFGSPYVTRVSQSAISPTTFLDKQAKCFSTPILEESAAVFASPSRCLFVYSPILILSLAGVWNAWRERGQLLLRYLSIWICLHLIPVATLTYWWGGNAYGPRLLSDTLPLWCLLLSQPFERIERWG